MSKFLYFSHLLSFCLWVGLTVALLFFIANIRKSIDMKMIKKIVKAIEKMLVPSAVITLISGIFLLFKIDYLAYSSLARMSDMIQSLLILIALIPVIIQSGKLRNYLSNEELTQSAITAVNNLYLTLLGSSLLIGICIFFRAMIYSI